MLFVVISETIERANHDFSITQIMPNHSKIINNGFNGLHELINAFTFLTNRGERVQLDQPSEY